jgi:signal transduction histidine kinase
MPDSGGLSFPDAQRGELDHALDNLVARAHDVLRVQGRLRSLLRANQAIIEHLEISVVLERIVQAAVDLVGAQYGALGIVAPDGSLEQFITVGMSEHDIERIGHSPEGHGLLGALIEDPIPIRLDRLADDERSTGFPDGHPPMESFLGVPIRVRDDVYGNLYLSNQANGRFTEDDQQLVTSLAATAGVAIDNARLFSETDRRQAWSAASEEFTAKLLSSDQDDAIATLASRILSLSEADIVWVLVPTDDDEHLLAEIARGVDAADIEGTILRTGGSILASVLEAGQPRQIDDGYKTELGLSNGKILGPVMAVPLIVAGLAQGVLVVGRIKGRARFSSVDLEMAAHFAGQASIAMELAAARGVQQRMELLEERGRIARDLHDHVIQQLFGTGLELQSVAGSLGSLPTKVAADRIFASVQNLDASIAQIRTVIFALSVQTDDSRNTVRHWIIDLVKELTPGLGSAPRLTFAGPVDLIITDEMAADVVAVTREALMNVIKHAGAEHSSVTLTAIDGAVALEISDDGRGFDGSDRRSGVANLEARAQERGGSLTVDSDATGTRLLWTVPYGELVP